jgi:hypothetical protein
LVTCLTVIPARRSQSYNNTVTFCGALPIMADEKKIFIDEDWKEEAQREKEKLAEELEKQKQELPPLPEASFEVLLSSLATPAMLNLGMFNVPDRQVNLDEAKFYIDLLEILERKTKGNLDTREHNALTSLLYELRMGFVAANQKTAVPPPPS